MPRRREIADRPVISDAKYNSKLVAKFIKSIMRDGKKSLAESIIYDAFDIIEKKTTSQTQKLKLICLQNTFISKMSTPMSIHIQ